MFLLITLNAWTWLTDRLDRREFGQATAEYALVLLGAASIALLVVGWAARSGRVGDLMDTVFSTISRKAK